MLKWLVIHSNLTFGLEFKLYIVRTGIPIPIVYLSIYKKSKKCVKLNE